MANRMICFGYGIRDGKLSVIENEAETVRRIFREYIDGKILKEIADELSQEGVDFFMGDTNWNKNRISRIIENEKYIGADEYPQIVNDDEFVCAKQLKESKGAKKKRFDEITESLRANRVICEQCGKQMSRIHKWKRREKWVCRNGCKNDLYVSDDIVFNGINKIVGKICENPDVVKAIAERKDNNLEIRRYANEINRLLGSKNPTFGAGKKLIFHLAELKFEICNEKTPDIYNDLLIEKCKTVLDQGKADKEFLEKFCKQVLVDKTGNIAIKFINGVKVSAKGE